MSKSADDSTPPSQGTATRTRKQPASKPVVQQLPPFNVVLLNDDDHGYDYVVEMLGKLFGYSAERGMQMAKEVDSSGRVIVLTTHLERAELKRDQIVSYGPDRAIAACTQSMRAIVEPAEG